MASTKLPLAPYYENSYSNFHGGGSADGCSSVEECFLIF